MKILAIRGENLASLEGAFSVEFEAGPLERAGLFAITGPTGAGKTTLLDALCVALFGTTPRMNAVQGRGHEVGRADEGQRLRNNDARALLRRGTGSGFAEVEFIGNDGKRYVARWTVRRARGRADGRLQNVEHELRDEEGTAIGRTLTDVQREIQKRLGLDYEQFCRSVLLAQGEFAAFLRADEKKRAELLEAVTGTGIYRELSIKAHERFAAAKQALAELRREHDAQPVLDGEALAVLQAELAARDASLVAAKASLQQAADALRWYRELAEKAEAEGAAALALQGAEGAWSAAAPVRERLQAVAEVAALRPLVSGADEAAARRAAVATAREKAAAAAVVAAAAAREAQEAVARAVERERELVALRDETAPRIKEALQLDSAIGAAGRREGEAASEADRLARRAAELRQGVEKLLVEAQAVAREIATIDGWRAGHAGWQPVAAQWERWEAALFRAAELHAERRRGEVELPRAEEAFVRVQAELARARSRAVTATAAAAAGGKALEAAEAARSPEGGAPLRILRDALEGEAALARELETIARDATAADAARLRGATLLQEQEAEAAALEQVRAASDVERARLAREVESAQEVLLDARAVLDLEGRRAELLPEKECPLCGSTEHPWAGQVPPAAGMVGKYQQRLDGLRAELAACERRFGEAAGKSDEAARQVSRLREELQGHEALLASLQAAWTERQEDASRALADEAIHGRGGVAAWIAGLAERREALRALEKEAEAAEGAAARARAASAAARTELDAALGAVRTAETQAEQAGVVVREARAALERTFAEAQRLAAEVGPAFAAVEGFEAALASDPAALAARAAKVVAASRAREAERTRAMQRRDELAAAIVPAEEAAAEAGTAAAAAAATLEACRAEVEELRARRRELLGGEEVAAVEARLRRDAEVAAAALEQARRLESDAAGRASAATALVEAEKKRLAEETQVAADRAQALAAAAAERGIEEVEIRRRLAIPAADIERWAEEAERLRLAREQALVRLEERRAQREAMEAGERPAVAREEAEAAHGAAAVASKEAEDAYHDTRGRLAADEKARARSAAFLPRIEAAERENARWEKMHELIGSSGGDKFQLFAQSLTLDALLAGANAHLADLAPRYRLERAPGANLELQVIDRDMADEVRSTNSLSGGETFLVSLALALGLSALSSRSTKVESLFIDEGFGTLDPQTLDTALATLDALQAAGRKVGLISHVQGMAERIGVQVRVAPQGSGSSRVEVLAA